MVSGVAVWKQHHIPRRTARPKFFPSRKTLAAALPMLLLASCEASGRVPDRSAAIPLESSAGVISTRELVEVTTLSGLRVSPNQRLAVVREERQEVSSSATILTWRIIDLQTAETTAIIDAGDPFWNNNGGIAREAPVWSPDSKRIYFRKVSGEEVQIWEAPSDGGQPQQLTQEEADIAAFEVGPDDSITYVAAGATRTDIKLAEIEEHSRGVLMGPAIIAGLRMERGFPFNGRMATYRYLEGADGDRRGTLLAKRYPRVMRLPAGRGQAIRVSEESARTFLDGKNVQLGPTRSAGMPVVFDHSVQSGDLIATVDTGGEPRPVPATSIGAKRRVFWGRVGASASQRVQCLDPLCINADMLQLVGWRSGQRELILQAESLGVSQLIVWDIYSNKIRVVMERNGVVGSDDSGTVGACGVAGDRVVCIASASNEPPHVVAIDLVSGQITTLHDPNPGLTQLRLGDAMQVRLVDRYGNITIGRVILPRSRTEQHRLPLVITSYSCRGLLLGGSGRDVPEHVLASRGYAAVCVDMGAGTVQKAPGFKMTSITGDNSALDFVEAAVDVLSDAGIADPKRVAISGYSASSTYTTSALARSRKFTAAIVTTAGSFDAITCYLSATYRSCETLAKQEGFERPYDAREGILKNSPAWNADKIHTPLLMQLPESEYPEMMQLYGALLDYDRAVEMYVFAGAFHYKNDPKQRLTVYDRNVEWIEFWLKGLESARTDLTDQYLRWREMREGRCSLPAGDRDDEDPPWFCAPRH